VIDVDHTTLVSVIAIALSFAALVLNSRRMTRNHRASVIGPPLRRRHELGRHGRPDLHEVLYEPYLMEPTFVMRRRWARENAEIEAQGRLFHVPGPKDGPVHWDHAIGWMEHAEGLSIRVRFLRIENRATSGAEGMTNDAVTIEFASQAEFAEFLSKLPATPSPQVITREPVGLAAIMTAIRKSSETVGTHG
jgi:hypothetical protein